MTLDALAVIYLVGAIITGFSATKLKRFYRCVLLWPLFWVYLAVIVTHMAIEDVRR